MVSASYDWISTKIEQLCLQNDVEVIVVGLPLNIDGTKGKMALEVQRFASKLETRIKIPVKLIDERLTSVQSRRILRSMNVKYSLKKEKVDQMSAVLILQTFLDRQDSDIKINRGEDD